MSERGITGATGGGPEAVDFEEGRYLYCAVEATGAADQPFSTTGVDGGTPYLLRQGDLGLVVQPCSAPYESTSVGTLQQWLRQHQAVVDEASETYGTPLPFRFDTIITGDDQTVRDWLDGAADDLGRALQRLAGHREYRVEVRQDRAAVEDRLAEEDERLAELNDRRESAAEGRAFLLEKQFQQALRGRAERRHAETVESISDRLREVATEVRAVDRTPSALAQEGDTGDEKLHEMLAVLAPVADEADVGDRLDAFADRPGVEIRFTGPWPPYTFAPELGPDT